MTIDFDAKYFCFRCKKEVVRIYRPSKKNFSTKNDWYYWTEKEENKDKYVCNKCLVELYEKDKIVYLNSITNLNKRSILRNYINMGLLKEKKED